MKKITGTIAGQLIALISGVILLSQLLILSSFFYKTDERIDHYETRFVVQRIVSIYEKLQTTIGEKRELLLEFSSNSDVSFFITQEPKGQTKEQIFIGKKWSADQLRDTLISSIYAKEKNLSYEGFSYIWYFWFSNEWSDCFANEEDDGATATKNCPNRVFSLHLNENEWLNIRIVTSPNEAVILFPMIIAAFFTMIGIMLVVVFAVKRITAPLNQLSEAADRLGRGEVIPQLDVHGPQELSLTIQAFNLMQERITRFIKDRTKMLAAISHDLRTPITSLRLNVEFVENNDLRRKMINTLEDMQVMVEAGLIFSKQDAQEEKNKVIDLVELLENLAEDSSHITFSSVIPSYDYSCRSVNIKRAIRNLLENAVKYGMKAHMVFEKSESGILITIQDQGPGIPEDRLEDMFEPFIRLDEARNTEAGSIGLGLSIARTIVHKHGGIVDATNTYPGLKINVSLPIT